MKLSCVTASYVMDLLGYPGHFDWSAASEAILRAPILETIDDLLRRLAPAKLDGVEFWYPHVWPSKVTPSLASAIRRRLRERGMACSACAGAVSNPLEDPDGCEELFQVARLLKAERIAGHVSKGGLAELTRLCADYGISLAYENGGERSAAEILAAIAGGNEWIKVNLDTGNLAAQGGDPVQAIRELGPLIQYIHFKDVPAVGAHECVALGEGIVDVRGVIRELKRIGYGGWLSIEIETCSHDPTTEIIASAETLRKLWSEST